MNKKNRSAAILKEPVMRITRTRAKALGLSGELPPLYPSIKQDDKRVLRPNSKRAASDENKSAIGTACLQPKKRAVLKDVTNICENSYINCINATQVQPRKQAENGTLKNKAKVAPEVFVEGLQVLKATKANITDEIAKQKVEDIQEFGRPVNIKENLMIQPSKCISLKEHGLADMMLVKQISSEECKPCQKLEGSDGSGIADIDSNYKDPQMCSVYAPDIYNNLRAAELDRRPSGNYMEMMQRDITKGMRGILIDWLVEVSEEYRLVPDTLYLTVNLIDRFLSENYIAKQKLQLLGVACILIASKYEEICAPSAEELCLMTDNTYTRKEVLKMESQVLNFLGFQLSIPTTKKFLRRFIQAGHVSYKAPCVELEFLANYLAELTLIEYSFLKFLPSLIAASAVFLARWTLDQSDHPWNPTLEHYSSYKASELEATVFALQDLQLNTNGDSLNAIREKYDQPKFKCVATLSSPKSVQSLFQDG